MATKTQFIREVRFGRDTDKDEYPFSLPVVQQIVEHAGALRFPSGVTFLVGENGSGKSTLVEAIAVAAGLNPEGGSQNYRFETRSTESQLGEYLSLTWGTTKPRSRFFLRAESYYNVATETERLGPEQIAALGGVSAHERSHGESFVDLLKHRFSPNGLYLLDEPEAALSINGCMAVIAHLASLAKRGCQILIATHSPILLALPGATIYEIADDGSIDVTTYDDALPVRMSRDFLADPDRYLRHLID